MIYEAGGTTARGGRSPASIGLMARYQLLTLALLLVGARQAAPGALPGILVGGALVAMNLQLSRLMAPLLAVLRARVAAPRQQIAWVGAASLAKLVVQLAVAAFVLVTWPPASGPFLVGMGSFLGGALGAAAHGVVAAQRGAVAGRRAG